MLSFCKSLTNSLLWLSIVLLIFIFLALFYFDHNNARAFAVSGMIVNLVGVAWIAAGVVLSKNSIRQLLKASQSNVSVVQYIGPNPVKKVVPDLFFRQSSHTTHGVALVVIGTFMQIIAQYIDLNL